MGDRTSDRDRRWSSDVGSTPGRTHGGLEAHAGSRADGPAEPLVQSSPTRPNFLESLGPLLRLKRGAAASGPGRRSDGCANQVLPGSSWPRLGPGRWLHCRRSPQVNPEESNSLEVTADSAADLWV